MRIIGALVLLLAFAAAPARANDRYQIAKPSNDRCEALMSSCRM
jgi:hypothetical protein